MGHSHSSVPLTLSYSRTLSTKDGMLAPTTLSPQGASSLSLSDSVVVLVGWWASQFLDFSQECACALGDDAEPLRCAVLT